MTVINTNLTALIAQNAARANEGFMAKANERLSSGQRINSAKDDAAGLAISTRMTSAIRGLGMAIRNASDGISVAQTADGALGEITNILQRIREISIQAANASLNKDDRSFLNTEASGLVQEVDRIGNQTNFNSVKLLDGSFTSRAFQVGYNPDETITFSSIVQSNATGLGSHILVMDSGAANNLGTGSLLNASASKAASNGVIGSSTMTLSSASSGISTNITTLSNSSAKSIAQAINIGAASIGITARATNAATLGAISNAGTVSFTLYGSSNTGSTISASVTSVADLSTLANAINGTTSNTGITATFASSTVKDTILLTSSDGSDITVENYLNSSSPNATISFSEDSNGVGGGSGRSVVLTGNGATGTSTKVGIVTLSSTRGAITMTNPVTSQTASAASTFSGVNSIDITNVAGATRALGILEDAMTQVNSTRAGMGALVNRFEAVISSQSNTILNVSASRSRILDADYAKETSILAKSMIIQQAATAMLGQANQNPMLVMHLLK
jgi:flagellin